MLNFLKLKMALHFSPWTPGRFETFFNVQIPNTKIKLRGANFLVNCYENFIFIYTFVKISTENAVIIQISSVKTEQNYYRRENDLHIFIRYRYYVTLPHRLEA
jgi:hypothetical protein